MPGWSDRMDQVFLADQAAIEATGKRLSGAALGRQMGLSHTRIHQLRYIIDRYIRTHHDDPPDAHVRAWQHWVHMNAKAVLPLLIRAAEGKPLLKPPPRVKFVVHNPAAVPRYSYEGPRHSYHHPIVLTHYTMSQEDLHEMAKTHHWTDVVYRSGTDYIVYIKR